MALTKVTSDVRTLGNNEVGSAQISANAVTSSELADNAVTSSKISDDAVGLAEMAHGTDGNLISYDASGAPAHVATGSVNQILVSNGAGAAPTFQNLHSALPSGSVLEELWLPQNGTSQTVSSGTYTGANITAYQDLTDAYADITGSSINYTPPSGATRVVYSLHLYSSFNTTSDTYSHYKTYLDSTEVTAARANNSARYLDHPQIFTWVFLIGGSADTATGQVASWTSAKQIKMQARMYSDSYNQRLHQTYYWDGVTSGQNHVPVINIKAIK